MLPLLTWITAGIIFGSMLTGGIVSFKEKEIRAGLIFISAAVILPIIFVIPTFLAPAYFKITAGILNIFFYGFLFVSFFPLSLKKRKEGIVPREKIDERDTMFSRDLLEAGTKEYEKYYANKPDKKDKDDKFRRNPGLLQKGTLFYDKHIFNAAEANFDLITENRRFVKGKVAERHENVKPEKTTKFIKQLAKKFGAQNVGITKLQDYHLYSHRGRKHNYGEKVENKHKYTIAITVEMDHDFVRNAPKALAVLESSRQYVRSGIIALRIAQYIRRMGYDARAHIDGEYEVICPLVARDAGLGEIGRMGLLMAPELGPRIRIAAITTSIPLVRDERKEENSIIDFCKTCKKCAEVCPSRAIPFKDREKIHGVLRWQIDQEACFTYWTKAGTDCARCMSVCPYSHPDNSLHKLVRHGIKNSPMFRYFAVKMDDFFYGRKPKTLELKEWKL
ncbi:MAG: reductive dehalogenase domain-containing protein [Bacteroidales bacterium]